MSYIFSFVGKYLLYGLCALIIYLPIRFVYIKTKKIEPIVLNEAVLVLFVFCFAGMISQTLFPLIRIKLNDGLVIKAFYDSGNSFVLSKHGIAYRAENEIIRNYNLIPFKTIFQFIFGSSDIYSGKAWILNRIVNMIGNIILFFPIGLFLPLVNERFKSFTKTCLFGITVIFLVEIIQYLTGRSADIDDLILNMTGLIAGYFSLKILSGIRTNRRAGL
ncbi:MAG: VanZ family protein [Acutalibacteraceae bacterium]|nr:VanZ family protein [Acutalibacteraceae bacterium]